MESICIDLDDITIRVHIHIHIYVLIIIIKGLIELYVDHDYSVSVFLENLYLEAWAETWEMWGVAAAPRIDNMIIIQVNR